MTPALVMWIARFFVASNTANFFAKYVEANAKNGLLAFFRVRQNKLFVDTEPATVM